MRDTVAEKVDKLRRHHEGLKEGKRGYLVRPLTLALGWLVFVVGVITIPFPGPGWLTVFVGMGILSLELHWAQRLLAWGVERYDEAAQWYQTRSRPVRLLLGGLLLLLIWAVFALIAYVMWRMDALEWAGPVVNPVMAWLGLER